MNMRPTSEETESRLRPGKAASALLGFFSVLLFFSLVAYFLRNQPRTIKSEFVGLEQCLIPSLSLIYQIRPNCKAIANTPTGSIEFHFNSLGIRDREYSQKPKKGVKRLLFFGTSQLVGPGLNETDTFPRRLESRLRAEGLKIEVINGGVSGYTGVQNYFFFKKLLQAYNPDYVVYIPSLGLHLVRENAYSSFIVRDAKGTPILLRPNLNDFYSWVPGIEGFLSRPENWIRLWNLDHSLRVFSISWRCYFLFDSDRYISCLAGRSIETIEAINELADRNNLKFLAIAYPTPVGNGIVEPGANQLELFRLVRALTPRALVPFESIRGYFQVHFPSLRFFSESVFSEAEKVSESDQNHIGEASTQRWVDDSWPIFFRFVNPDIESEDKQ